ncbi:MAG: Fe-S protein assembly co-chaperone HscB [Pseudomonadota bacterium]|jgi:molecular chaperone HscB
MGLPRRFGVDPKALDARWKDLQRQTHPDRFAAQGAAAQRVAMQWSVRVNEAYQRLRDPVKRAAYLCELAGAAIDAERNTAMPGDFLMQQMQWREELDEARTPEAMENLLDQVLAARSGAVARLGALLDEQADPQTASGVVRALMFIQRFAEDVQDRLEQAQSQRQ